MVTIAYLPSKTEAEMEEGPTVYGHYGKLFFYFWLIWLG